MRVFKTSSQSENLLYVMALKLVIVFLINSAIAEELVSSNRVSVLPIPPGNPELHDQAVNLHPETNYDKVIELQKEDSSLCYSDAVLIPILNQLLNTLMNDPTYEHKVSKISALLREYFPDIIVNPNTKDETKPNNVEGQNAIPKVGLRTGFNDLYIKPITKGHVKTKIVFKYDLPSINQSPCKNVFMKLMKAAYEAYMQLAKHPTCQYPGLLEELINKYNKVPQYHGNSANNGATSVYTSDDEDKLNLYDLLTPKQPELVKYNSYGLNPNTNKNAYDLTNPYGNEPYQTIPSKNIQNLESYTNIIEKILSDKPRPNNYDSNAYYSKNNNRLTLNDGYDYLSQKYAPNYKGSPNIPQAYDNNNKIKGLLENKYAGNVLQYANIENLNEANMKTPQHSLQVPINVLANVKNQRPLDSLLFMLTKQKSPDGSFKVGDKPLQLSYGKYQNVSPNNNQMPVNPNMYYPSPQNQNLKNIAYQYPIPGIGMPNQIPKENLGYKEVPNQAILTQNVQPFYKDALSQEGSPYNQITIQKPYLPNMQNNYLNKLGMSPNIQYYGASNAVKLDSSKSSGVIELTYVLKNSAPLMYRPSYFVKFRIPYLTFLQTMQNLLIRKPYLKNNPSKLYQELVALSNVSDLSPDLKGYTKDDLLRLAFNSGELVTAKLIKDDKALSHQLKMVQKLNSGIGAADIWKIAVKNKGFLKTNAEAGNSTHINNPLVRNGNLMPLYDLSSSGVGFNPGPVIPQQHPTGGDAIGVQTTKINHVQSKVIPQNYRYGHQLNSSG